MRKWKDVYFQLLNVTFPAFPTKMETLQAIENIQISGFPLSTPKGGMVSKNIPPMGVGN